MFLRLFILIFPLVSAWVSHAQDAGRTTLVWNRDWQFKLSDSLSISDKEWQHANIPHSFSLPYFMSDTFYVGEGVYKKNLNVTPAWQGKKIMLDIEAAFQVADVFVNGNKAGTHTGGYTAFRTDLTSHLKPGGNEILIKVSNRWNPRIAPRAGEHCFSGGIYRDVYLTVTDPVHIPLHGVWVRTPQVSAQKAVVSTHTEIKNDKTAEERITVYQIIRDQSRKTVAEFSKQATIPAGETVEIIQQSPEIASPRLWSPKTPYVYRVLTIVKDKDGNVLDHLENPLGFRTIEWTADRGFFLNGKHLLLQGANVHQDHAGWGDAVTNGGHRRDVKLMKQAGFNFLRGSHYPHDPAFAKACDELGLCFWSEGIFWGMGGQKEHDTYWNCDSYPRNPEDRPGFEASCEQQLREMIKENRNHPSIIAWSVSNEPFFTHDTKEAKQFCAKLITIAKEMDPDRPASVGGAQRGGFDKLGDIASYNGDGAHVKNPGKPSMVSEYGSVSCKRPGNYDPCWGDTKGETWPWRAGQAIWCGFDHGSVWASGARMGIVDYFRIPKRAWYWYRNELAGVAPPAWPKEGTPFALKLETDTAEINSIDGQDDAHITVYLVDKNGDKLSNTAPVTLTIESGPGEFPTGKSITFTPKTDIDMIDGCAAIEMRSYYAGKSIVKATSPGLKEATLAITAKGKIPYKKGISKETTDRPYKKFTRKDLENLLKQQGLANDGKKELANLASNRPCKSTSNNQNAQLASDNNPATYWQADAGDGKPMWTLDMEFEFGVTDIILDLPDSNQRTIRIETSLDGQTWSDFTKTSPVNTTHVESKSDKPAKCRYVRVSFGSAEQAALSEIRVHADTKM